MNFELFELREQPVLMDLLCTRELAHVLSFLMSTDESSASFSLLNSLHFKWNRFSSSHDYSSGQFAENAPLISVSFIEFSHLCVRCGAPLGADRASSYLSHSLLLLKPLLHLRRLAYVTPSYF